MMMDKLFFNPRKQPKAISLFTLGAAILLACIVPRLGADSVPDWVRAAARDTLPPVPNDAVAVVLPRRTDRHRA
jgi:hypothetical protein